jgi:hypothetical protein
MKILGKKFTSVQAKGFCLMVLLLGINFIKRLRNKPGSPKKIL